MSLIRWTPATRMLSRWPDIWDEDMNSLLSGEANNLDLFETKDEVVVRANVAGVETNNVDITFEKGVLWIQAKRVEEEKDDSKKHYSKASWNYSYKVAVPGMIDYTQEPTAEVKNGVVTITFKKAEASKPKKLTVVEK